jgi:integrase/recombinase XerD
LTAVAASTGAGHPGLPVTQLAPMIRELGRLAVKDKRYLRCPVGTAGGRYLRHVRFALAKNTYDSYELVIAWLALDHADFDSLERFCAPDGEEYLEEFLYRHWADAAAATKRQRRSIVRAFFQWAYEHGQISRNPGAALRGRIRGSSRQRQAYDRDTIERLVSAQTTLRDQCALGLMARFGLRKNELRMLRLGEIDLARNLVTVLHGKGSKIRVLPLEFEDLREDLDWHLRERGAEAREDGRRVDREHLLYPRNRRLEPMDLSSVHRWFKRCLDSAGLPESMTLHELRHTAADDVWRRTGNIVSAQLLLGHESPGTTSNYLHPTEEDLRSALRLVDASWKAERDASDRNE